MGHLSDKHPATKHYGIELVLWWMVNYHVFGKGFGKGYQLNIVLKDDANLDDHINNLLEGIKWNISNFNYSTK